MTYVEAKKGKKLLGGAVESQKQTVFEVSLTIRARLPLAVRPLPLSTRHWRVEINSTFQAIIPIRRSLPPKMDFDTFQYRQLFLFSFQRGFYTTPGAATRISEGGVRRVSRVPDSRIHLKNMLTRRNTENVTKQSYRKN